MRPIRSAVLLACVCLGGPALAADRQVHLTVAPPIVKDIAAMPQIADPIDDAERHINAALKRLDLNALKAASEPPRVCRRL
jgi:hypothetical protein